MYMSALNHSLLACLIVLVQENINFNLIDSVDTLC
jgi:hypothetical protein